jgi:hypothetical protein
MHISPKWGGAGERVGPNVRARRSGIMCEQPKQRAPLVRHGIIDVWLAPLSTRALPPLKLAAFLN